jgi:L-asparaginase
MGFVAADELNPPKARILLMLALLKPRRLDQIQQIFLDY